MHQALPITRTTQSSCRLACSLCADMWAMSHSRRAAQSSCFVQVMLPLLGMEGQTLYVRALLVSLWKKGRYEDGEARAFAQAAAAREEQVRSLGGSRARGSLVHALQVHACCCSCVCCTLQVLTQSRGAAEQALMASCVRDKVGCCAGADNGAADHRHTVCALPLLAAFSRGPGSDAAAEPTFCSRPWGTAHA